MPFPFTLPTTSAFGFSTSFESSSHPSLPIAASTYRGVLRDSLKKHKRLAPAQQLTNLPYIQQAIDDYLPYLLALDAGLSSRTVSNEEIDVVLRSTPSLEWRPTLSTSSIPGREPPRLKLQSLEYELAFTLSTQAYVQTLLARSYLQPLYNVTTQAVSPEIRTASIQSALKSLLTAASIHEHISTRLAHLPSISPSASDLSAATHRALSELAHGEATLLAVLKDDPHPGAIAQESNTNDREWMIKAPSISKVRAMLFARLCLAASEHAAKAGALLRGVNGTQKVDETLLEYVENLRLVGRAKACRFFGLDAEMGGQQGVALGWLDASLDILTKGSGRAGLASNTASGSTTSTSKFSFRGLKQSVSTKREEARVHESRDWGMDAGKAEEARVVRYLSTKWTKVNDTVNTQIVAAWGPLIASMPTGREFTSISPWKGVELEARILSELRSTPNGDEGIGQEEDSEDEGGGDSRGPTERREYSGAGGYY